MTLSAMAQYLVLDSFPTDMLRVNEAEKKYYEILAGAAGGSSTAASSTLVSEIVKARQQIQKSLDGQGDGAPSGQLEARVAALEEQNQVLRKTVAEIASVVEILKTKIAALEGQAPAKAAVEKPVPKQQEKGDDSDDDDDDDDFDLFGEDDDDEEEREKLKAERVAAYNAKKATKTAVIAKSSVLLDVKPWDDETDMAALEKEVRTIVMDGLVWGASKLVPVGYGIKKLQIMCVVEDEKVSVDDLSEQICEFEDYVQSVDIAAFSKI